MANVMMVLNEENQAMFRNQTVVQISKEDGIKFGTWQDDKLVAAFGQSEEWHWFGHRIPADTDLSIFNEGWGHVAHTFATTN